MEGIIKSITASPVIIDTENARAVSNFSITFDYKALINTLTAGGVDVSAWILYETVDGVDTEIPVADIEEIGSQELTLIVPAFFAEAGE